MSTSEPPNHSADPLGGVAADRRQFLRVVLAASVVSVPVVTSVGLSGAMAVEPTPDISGATTAAPNTSQAPSGETTTAAPEETTTSAPEETTTTPAPADTTTPAPAETTTPEPTQTPPPTTTSITTPEPI